MNPVRSYRLATCAVFGFFVGVIFFGSFAIWTVIPFYAPANPPLLPFSYRLFASIVSTEVFVLTAILWVPPPPYGGNP